MQIQEKRKSQRHSAGPPLTYQLSLSGDKRSARGIDHNADGFSFENSSEIKPGSIVYARRDGCPPDCIPGEACLGCRSVALATIRWCRKIKTREREFYRIGLKYFD